MSYILIPTSKIYLHEISFILNKTNQIENKNNLNDIFISESLYLYLNNIKEKIKKMFIME